MIKRIIGEDITATLDRHKAVVIMGARQVGKSTLLDDLFGGRKDVKWYSGDDPSVREILSNVSTVRLKSLVGDSKLVIIDEAQKIPFIGNTMKLITDQMPEVGLVATGSSSFELASSLGDTLTGRKRELRLFPVSFAEMVKYHGLMEEERSIPDRMLYGYYPEVLVSPGEEKEILKELSESYLYKDILSFDRISKGDKLVRLVQALALQIGSPVSFNELAQTVSLDAKTVEKYVDVLEKCFVIFRLPSYAKNLRNELKFSRKLYFYDLGIRNAVLGNFTPLHLRTSEEVGHIWENWVIAERKKKLSYLHSDSRLYFWRTRQSREIDFLEECDGGLSAYECKWGNAKVKIPSDFEAAYPGTEYTVINQSNVVDYLL